MKKQFFRFFVVAVIAILAVNNAAASPDTSEYEPKSELKILGIGNSFTDDAMKYLPDLLSSAGINHVTLGKMAIAGASLSRHLQAYAQNTADYKYVKSVAGANVWSQSVMKTFIEGVSDENWDIIIIQQVSGDAGIYSTYQPHLNDLINLIRNNSANTDVTLGWQMAWAYATNSTHSSFPKYNSDQMQMYQSIVDAVKTMLEMTTGIDVIVPSATAIQNLRGTSVNNPPLDLTRDGFHADYGAGRYTLACTWYEALIAPFVKTTIVGNPFRVNAGNVPVTNENYLLCQKAAKYACNNPFVISIID